MVYRSRYDYLEEIKSLKVEIESHKKIDSITESTSDAPLVVINFSRAQNEFKQSETLLKVSSEIKLKEELKLVDTDTFYSGTISHAYYSIFFCAKALLFRIGVITKSPNIHKATLDSFAYYHIINGMLDIELLKIYKSLIIKADSLLSLFLEEKEKRGEFTYLTLPDANKLPAEESIRNAREFILHTKNIIESKKETKGDKNV